MGSWAVRPFKFQSQNVKDEYLGPGLPQYHRNEKVNFKGKIMKI